MERREALLKCLGGAALALAQSKLLPATGTVNDRTREFYELWEEACLSHDWFEDKSAYNLCLRALALAPENLESSKRADIIEKLGQIDISLIRGLMLYGMEEWNGGFDICQVINQGDISQSLRGVISFSFFAKRLIPSFQRNNCHTWRPCRRRRPLMRSA
jgi:hypothetical protein